MRQLFGETVMYRGCRYVVVGYGVDQLQIQLEVPAENVLWVPRGDVEVLEGDERKSGKGTVEERY